MKIFDSIVDIRSFIKAAKVEGLSIGFVPTMGALHEGHLALVRESKGNTDITVVSIFVNPTQFGPNEDYEKYQRNLEQDSQLCDVEGVDVVFAPAVTEMYPAKDSVVVKESALSKNLCGRTRPGHFSGVLTVVAKLFNIIDPDMAFFGQKDAQQVRIIEQMIRDLNFDIELKVVPTVREYDGLALSSRNSYLTAEQRVWAPRIYEGMQKVLSLYKAGEKDVSILRQALEAVLTGNDVEVDYIEFVDWKSFESVDTVNDGTLLAVAVRVGDTRLIDNIMFPSLSFS